MMMCMHNPKEGVAVVATAVTLTPLVPRVHGVFHRNEVAGDVCKQHVFLESDIAVNKVKIICFRNLLLKGIQNIFKLSETRQRPFTVRGKTRVVYWLHVGQIVGQKVKLYQSIAAKVIFHACQSSFRERA